MEQKKAGRRTGDAVGQVGELLGVVQHLHALGVGVVAHRERLRDGRGKFPVEQADGRRETNTAIKTSLRREPTSLSLWHFQSSRQQSTQAGTL